MQINDENSVKAYVVQEERDAAPRSPAAHKLAVGDRVVSVCDYRCGQAGTVADLIHMMSGPGYGVRFGDGAIGDLAEREVAALDAYAAVATARRARVMRHGGDLEAARQEAVAEAFDRR